MSSKGLQHSRWAGGNNDESYYRRTAGHWQCNFCHTLISLSSAKCPECQPPPPLVTSEPARHSQAKLTSRIDHRDANDRISADTGKRLPDGRVSSSTLGSTAGLPLSPDLGLGDLSKSCWAPKNASGRFPTEIWMRKDPSSIAAIQPADLPASSRYQTRRKTLMNVTLPYQVQHYILITIQRILEEGCYDFAARWVPQILIDQGLDCAEAVEPSKWRDILPSNVPLRALKPTANYSLDTALGDFVKLRNAATHRHLCDTNEVANMALHARDLMGMFSDETREAKFQILWEELGRWDHNATLAPGAARNGLEKVLKYISERPIDDMDWTPNAVSMQEVFDVGIVIAQVSSDEMDLD